jgi:3-oxoacyl-[acyl-carrier-protein] synthase-3
MHLPEHRLTSTEVEARIGPYAPPPGLLNRLTGIRARHVMADHEQASDLAITAARKLLAETGTAAADALPVMGRSRKPDRAAVRALLG